MTETGRGSDGDFDWGWADEIPQWIPPEVDITRPSPARMYDYALGGKDNFEVDRQAAEQVLKVAPDGPALARANRGFLVRAVRYLAEAGIDQFLDLGTGIPTSPAVHEIARQVNPQAKVVYVDNDPMVLAYNRALLAAHDGVITVRRDLREPATVLDDPQVREVIDFDRPVAMLLIAVLHFVDPVLAPEVVRAYLRRLARGSYLAISAGSIEGSPPEITEKVSTVYRQSSAPLFLRSRAQIEELFGDLPLVEPGLVEVNRWRAGSGPAEHRILAGVARKG